MSVLMATATADGDTGLLGTIRSQVRLWFVPLFSALVMAYAYTRPILNPDAPAIIPQGYLLFWGAVAVGGGYYAVRQSTDNDMLKLWFLPVASLVLAGILTTATVKLWEPAVPALAAIGSGIWATQRTRKLRRRS